MYTLSIILILSFIILGWSVFTIKLLINKKLEEKRKKFYTFLNEDGEEIPIGI